MKRTASPLGMLLDRDLSTELLELARQVSADDTDLRSSRRTLAVTLRDHVSDQEAEGKTKKCLTRAWLNPPDEASDVIAWGRVHVPARTALPVFHFGALLASFPFVGVVARTLGQHLRREGSIRAQDLRSEVKRIVGDRSSVDVAARKAYTTFRNLGLLDMEDHLLRPAKSMPAAGDLSSWLFAAVLCSRQATESPLSTLLTAPELLGLVVDRTVGLGDALLISHGAGGDTVVELRK